MRLTPRELVYFVELWSALGIRPRNAAELLEAKLTRKTRKRKRQSQHGNSHARGDR